jgi:hypothetical protein
MLNVYLHRSSSFIYYEIQCVAREKCDVQQMYCDASHRIFTATVPQQSCYPNS